MNYIFISPNYPGGHWKYAAALRKAGHNVLGIGDAGDETFPPELRGSLTEYRRVADLHDYDAVYRVCGYYISHYGRLDDVESLNPYWSDLVEALNLEFCGAPMLPNDCWRGYSAAVARNGQLPPSAVCSDADEAARFCAGCGYPVTAVPAEDKRPWLRTVKDEAQLRALFASNTAEKDDGSAAPYDGAWLICSRVAGEPVSVDGLSGLDESGREVVVALSAHVLGSEGSLCSVAVSDELRGRVTAMISETAECGFFHIDAVRLTASVKEVGKKGDIIINAVEDAPPHEYLVDCMNIEFDCDLRELWANGSETAEPLEQKFFAGAAFRSFERSYKNSHEKILRRLAAKLMIHGRISESDRERFGDYAYIFRGADAAELRRGIKYITEDFAK